VAQCTFVPVAETISGSETQRAYWLSGSRPCKFRDSAKQLGKRKATAEVSPSFP